jgi:NTP pyrophosphatase (non-canonical NTP hydrolase)
MQGLERGFRQGYTMHCSVINALQHLSEEYVEVYDAYNEGDFQRMRRELADLSNMCDLIFEAIQ